MTGLFDLPEALPVPEKEAEAPLPESVVKTTGCLEWHKLDNRAAIDIMVRHVGNLELLCYNGDRLLGATYNGYFYINGDIVDIKAYCIIPQSIKDFLKSYV